MNLGRFLRLVGRIAILSSFTMLSFALATLASGLANVSTPATPVSGTNAPGAVDVFLPVVLFSCLLSLVFGFSVFRSGLYGWKLILAIFVTFFGLMTIMTHSESIAFLGQMIGSGMIVKFFVMGLIFAGLFAPAAVIIMGRYRPPAEHTPLAQPSNPGVPGLIWRLGVIGTCYLIIYIVFGYYVAWKNPSVRAFYDGTDEGNLLRHLGALWMYNPWIFPFQFGRGVLWALFVLPVIMMWRGSRWEVRLTVALLFSVWSTQLLWPNPFLPKAVARIHFAETSTSNFLYGLIVASLLCMPKSRRLGVAETQDRRAGGRATDQRSLKAARHGN